RQLAPADPVRRERAGRARARGSVRGGDFEAVRRRRRRADRRARRRAREARLDALSARRGRSRGATPHQACVRPSAALESGQGLPRAAPLRRARSRARAQRRRALPVAAAVLMTMTEQEFAVAAERSRALAPRDEADLAEILRAQRGPFEVLGGGSKRSIGRPQRGAPLELAALTGVVAYEPAGLVLTARGATPLGGIERLLAERRQRLAFEPPRYAALLGSAAEPTIGGVCASNVSGSRRLAAGAARDHLLGLRAVNGRGERFAAGGRVVKNVTGYDLPKLLAGSWGTLAVL